MLDTSASGCASHFFLCLEQPPENDNEDKQETGCIYSDMLTIFRRKPARFRHMVSHLADEVQGKRCRSLATTSLSAQQSRPSDAAYRDSLASLIRQKLLHHHGFCRCACTAAASLGYAEHHVALRSRGRQGVEGVAGRLKRLKLQDLTPRKKRSQCRMCSGGRERICERSRLYKSLSVPALPALWSTTSSAVQVGHAARRPTWQSSARWRVARSG